MIKHKVGGLAIGVLSAVASAACAAPASSPPEPSPSLTAVAPGCDLSGTRVRWAKPTKQPRLTRVTLFLSLRADTAGQPGDDVLNEPFQPAIAHVAAPPEWTEQLAKSLSAETHTKVQSGAARMKDGTYGAVMGAQDDAGIPETLLYQGVETVSATFSVDCDQPVAGIFTSWTATSFGGVQCGQAEEPAEPLARLARHYCPRTASPDRSFDAVPFETFPPT